MYKRVLLFFHILLIAEFNTAIAQCNGNWTWTNPSLNYLCANGPFLKIDSGIVCLTVPQNTFSFSVPHQNVELAFSAFGTTGSNGSSRISIFLNGNKINLNNACKITLGCQTPAGVYSIKNGCLVDSISGSDGGISGFILLNASAFGLTSISSIGVAVTEPLKSGTIFKIKSCDIFPLPIQFKDTISLCNGDSIFIKNRFYTPNSLFKDTIPGGGCSPDTIKTTVIVSNNSGSSFSQNFAICMGDTITVNAHKYYSAGSYKDTLFNNQGCNTLLITNVSIVPASQFMMFVKICPADTFKIAGHYYFSPGQYFDTLVNNAGCDSILTTNLSFITAVYGYQFVKICPGDTLRFAGHSYFNPGQYVDTLVSHAGCDSVLTTDLSFITPVYGYQFASICLGDTFRFGGQNYFSAGIFNDTLKSNTGCDSIVITDLKIIPVTYASINVQICTGDTFNSAGHKYFSNGIFNDTLINALGCDSIITTKLLVLPLTSSTQIIGICLGDSFIFNNHKYFQSGNYTDTIKNSNGCDSIINTRLTLNKSPVLQLVYDSILCEGENDTIIIDAGIHISYFWMPTKETTQQIKVSKAGEYRVVVDDSLGCFIGGAAYIYDQCSPWVFIPNVFSPNGDGLNDFFKPATGFVTQFYMVIYNRWGEEVFRTDSLDLGWDGTYEGREAAEDVYVYIIEAKGTFNKGINEKGTLHLVR